MKVRTTKFNPKRQIASSPGSNEELEKLAKKVGYGGNPEHKINPGDFMLTPPADPRTGKTLCDATMIFTRDVALDLLKQGIRKGMVSVQKKGSYPQNVWAVLENGMALEAQLENQEKGTYHGYPMTEADPFREQVIKRWSQE